MELNWDFANLWEANANEKKEIHNEPKWKWDCGFKLDFDGTLLSISSRFYPPHRNNGNWWEGKMSILLLGEEIYIKDFKCGTLDELKIEVENFIKHYTGVVKSRLQ